MHKVKKWYAEEKAKKIVGILNQKGYTGIYVSTLDEVKDIIIERIPKNSSIALGGSVTLGKIDILKLVRNGDYKFYDRYGQKDWESTVETMRQSMIADFLITGTNAITKSGELVNVDSSGNRVAGMIFGPKNVIIVAGSNKVVNTLDDAFKRLRNIAPMNCKRLNGHNDAPCKNSGECTDCQSKDRVCNYTGIIHNGRKFDGRLTVIVVGEEIGF